jgi:tetratricopeptide (TPR) repeat protein
MTARARAFLTTALAALAPVAAFAPGCAEPLRPPGPLASALLALAADAGDDPQAVADAWADLRRLADRAAQRHRRAQRDPIADLDATVFDELGFTREIADDDPRFFLLPSVIGGRRGTCVGLSALYLALGERLGLGLDGILLPGHFFVRTRETPPRNIELLRRGEIMPDSWYRGKYGPWPDTAADGAALASYFRPVTISELVGVHWYNAGNHLRRAGDLAAAERDYERAVAAFPTLAEAHASLGSLRQLRGALAEADASYREAARLRPDLPGLVRNRMLLDQERRRDGAPAEEAR